MNLIQLAQRPWFRWIFRALALVAVGWGVSHTLQQGIRELGRQPWHVDVRWLVASGAIYIVALLPMAWFWRRALVALGQRPSWPVTLWAYFLGHLGKYVPGKVMVVLLRVGTLGKAVTSLQLAVVSTVLETLTMMVTGACIAAALAAWALHLDPKLTALAAAMAVLAALPTLPPIARRITSLSLWERVGVRESLDVGQRPSPCPLPKGEGVETEANDINELAGITASLLATGWLAAAVCWTLLGVSMWAALRAIGAEVPLVGELPLLVAAVSLAVVAGFLSLLPGGLFVRDAILIQLLAPLCGDANALIAAVLVRLVWLVSELAACGILYVGVRGTGHGAWSR